MYQQESNPSRSLVRPPAKCCSKCGHSKPANSANFHTARKSSGLRGECRQCVSAYNRHYYRANLDRLTAYKKHYNKRHRELYRRAFLKFKYKMTLTDYALLFYKQKGLCALCSESSGKLLEIDHCHRTGRIRGLVHHRCNILISHFEHGRLNIRELIAPIERYLNNL